MMNGPSQSLIHEYVLWISKVRVEFSVLSQKFPFFHPFTHSFTQSIYFFQYLQIQDTLLGTGNIAMNERDKTAYLQDFAF